jgi:hypothetical protein
MISKTTAYIVFREKNIISDIIVYENENENENENA